MAKLHNVKGWVPQMSCVPTALCAVTGKSFKAVMSAVRRAVEKSGKEALCEYPISVHPDEWKVALGMLGWDYHEVKSYRVRPQQDRPRLEQVIRSAKATFPDDVILIVCNEQTQTQAHVFAAQGENFVDIPTKGKVVSFFVDNSYISHRADYVLRLSQKDSKKFSPKLTRESTKRTSTT